MLVLYPVAHPAMGECCPDDGQQPQCCPTTWTALGQPPLLFIHDVRAALCISDIVDMLISFMVTSAK